MPYFIFTPESFMNKDFSPPDVPCRNFCNVKFPAADAEKSPAACTPIVGL